MCHSTESSSPFAPGGSNGSSSGLDRGCTVRCCRAWLLHYCSRSPVHDSRRLLAAFVNTLIRPVASNAPRAGQFAITFDLLAMTRVTAQDLPLSFLRSLDIWRLCSGSERVWSQIRYLQHVAALSIMEIWVVGGSSRLELESSWKGYEFSRVSPELEPNRLASY